MEKQSAPVSVGSFSKSVEIKKEFSLNLGAVPRLKERYKDILSRKLPGGKTLLQALDEVEHWYNNLYGEDLGNWIKLFAFAKAVREQAANSPDAKGLFEERGGVYTFAISADKAFYEFFAKPDAVKKDGDAKYHTTKLKEKIVAWLDKNQNAVEFPAVVTLPNNHTAVFPQAVKIYSFKKGVYEDGTPIATFMIDTNILEGEFKDYVSIDIDEIDAIAELWEETLKRENEETGAGFDLKAFSLNGFLDVPLKFLLALKNMYTREGNYASADGTYIGNAQTLSKENLDCRLGSLSERVAKHLIKRNIIRKAGGSDRPAWVTTLLLEAVFAVAVQRKWLVAKPGYQKGVYKFNINAGYFDRKATAKRISQLIETPAE